MDDRRGTEVDKRRNTDTEWQGTLDFTATMAGNYIIPYLPRFLDYIDHLSDRYYRVHITVEKASREGVPFLTSQQTESYRDVGGGNESRVGDSLVADVRRDRGDDSGASIRRIRDSGPVASDRTAVDEREGSGKGEGEEDDRFSFTDTELRMACQLYVHNLPSFSFQPIYNAFDGLNVVHLENRENRRLATEYLYTTIKNVLSYDGPETS